MNTHSQKLNETKPSAKKQTTFAPPDLLKVNEKDPNFAYRWIKPHDRMNFFGGEDPRGWEIVRWGAKGTENNSELNGLFSQFGSSVMGSCIRTGDLILARMPKAKAEDRLNYYLNRHRQRMTLISNPKRDISEQYKESFHGEAKTWKETKL